MPFIIRNDTGCKNMWYYLVISSIKYLKILTIPAVKAYNQLK